MAEEIERAVEAEPEPEKKTKRGRKPRTPPADSPDIVEMPVEAPPPDPEFVAMANWGVGAGVDAVKKKFDWTEPGVHWRVKVAECLASLVNRIRPMAPGPLTDALTAGGYISIWIIANVSAQRTAKDTNTVRDDGQRQDVQDAGIAPS